MALVGRCWLDLPNSTAASGSSRTKARPPFGPPARCQPRAPRAFALLLWPTQWESESQRLPYRVAIATIH